MTRLVVKLVVVAAFVTLPYPAWGDEGVSAGGSWFDATAETSTGGSSREGVAIDIEPSPAVVGMGISYSQRLACGDLNGNLATDSSGCDSSLIRCGVRDRGFLYYTVATYEDGTSNFSLPNCLKPIQVMDAAVVTERQRLTPALVQRAFERVPLPESEVVVQPPGGQTLVNLETIFSTEAEGFTETVTLLGRSVELDITPSSYRWSHGDSSEQTTDWPGQEWRRGRGASRYVTHTYDDRMRVSTRVDTTWSARYRVGSGRWQDVPGTVTIEGQPTALRVRSASPHLVGAADPG